MAVASCDGLCIWALARLAWTWSAQLLPVLYPCLGGKKGASSALYQLPGQVQLIWAGIQLGSRLLQMGKQMRWQYKWALGVAFWLQ